MTYRLSLSDTDGTVVYQVTITADLHDPSAYQLRSSMARRGLIYDLLDAIEAYEGEMGNA